MRERLQKIKFRTTEQGTMSRAVFLGMYQFYLVLDILTSRLALTFNYERLWSAVCSKSLISHLIKSKNYVKGGSTACKESSVQ